MVLECINLFPLKSPWVLRTQRNFKILYKEVKNQRNFTMVQIIHNPQNVELHLDNIKHQLSYYLILFDDMISFLRSNSVTVRINILSNNNYLVIFFKQISLPLNCSFWLWKYVLTQWTSNVLTQPLWIQENNKLIPITRSI